MSNPLNKQKIILGIDSNIKGVGWSLLKEVEGKPKLLNAGFYKIDEADSTNADRREKKTQRTQRRRKNSRKKKVIRFCIEHDLLTFPQEGLSKAFQLASAASRKMLEKELNPLVKQVKEFIDLDPWGLRMRAIEGQQLSSYELSRVFLQLSLRRGFPDRSFRSASSGKKLHQGSNTSNAVGAKVTKDFLDKQPQKYYAYLGKLLPKKKQPFSDYNKRGEHRIRNRYTYRSIYEAEFLCIWDKQSRYHQKLNEKSKKKLYHYLFYQLPIKAQKKGDCILEKNRKRCLRSSLLFEEFRAYLFANNFAKSLRTTEWEGDDVFFKRRDRIFNTLKANASISVEKLKQKAEVFLYSPYSLKKQVVGMPITRFFIKAFGVKRWDNLLSEKERNDIWHLVCQEDSTFFQIESLEKKYRLKPKSLTSFKMDKRSEGVSKYSAKAIRKILPYLKRGYTEDKAILLAGIPNSFVIKKEGIKTVNHWKKFNKEEKKQIIESVEKLLFRRPSNLKKAYQELLVKNYPEQVNFKKEDSSGHARRIFKEGTLIPTKNPDLDSTLAVTNKIFKHIRSHLNAPIDQINIEMARKLRQSKEDKIREIARSFQRANYNDIAIVQLQKNNIPATRHNMLKFKLWKECKGFCVYTGKPIPKHLLFDTQVDFTKSVDIPQIEHIVSSKPADSRMINLTLCFGSKNREKGEKTPFEAFGNTNEWEQIKYRASKCFYKKKLEHFLSEKAPEKKLTEGIANLTGYISKQTAKLMRAYSENVLTTKGGVVAKLRDTWGLDELLSPIIPMGNDTSLGPCSLIYVEKTWKIGDILPQREILHISYYRPKFEGRSLKEINKAIYVIDQALEEKKKDSSLKKRRKELLKEKTDSLAFMKESRGQYRKNIQEIGKALAKEKGYTGPEILFDEGFVEYCSKTYPHTHYIDGKERPCSPRQRFFFSNEKKNRKDERHHIVDAVVISTISCKQNFHYNNANKLGNLTEKKFPLPYPKFKEDLIKILTSSLVVHKRKYRGLEKRKVRLVYVSKYPDPLNNKSTKIYQWQKSYNTSIPRGKLHDETFFIKNKQFNLFSTRKKATPSLFKKAVYTKLRNPTNLLKKEGSPLFYIKNNRLGGDEVPIKKLRFLDEAKKIIEVRKNLFAKPGSNYAEIIYKKGSKYKSLTISFFDYIKIKRSGKNLRSHLLKMNVSPLIVLRKGDHFLYNAPVNLSLDNQSELISHCLYRLVHVSNLDYSFVRHFRILRNQLIRTEKELRLRSIKTLLKNVSHKVLLSPLGNILKITPLPTYER